MDVLRYKLKEGSLAKDVREIWAPTQIELDAEAARPLVLNTDALSDQFLHSYSQLQAGNTYLILSTEEKPLPPAKEEEAGGRAGDEIETRRYAATETMEEATFEETNDEAGARKLKRPAAETEEKFAKRQRKVAEEMSIKRLTMSLQAVLGEQQKQREELETLRKSHSLLSSHVQVLERYQLTGTTPRTAAYCFTEFAVETASALMRKIVAEKHFGLTYEVHRELFRSSFYQGYIEDVDFCRVVGWVINSTGLSLAEYWSQQGYIPTEALCETWNTKPEQTESNEDLYRYLEETEQRLAQDLGVPVKELSLFLRLYSSALRHQRNKSAHFFAVYSSVTRTKGQTGQPKFPRAHECKTKLEAAMSTSLKLKVLKLADLKMQYWVMERLEEQVGELEWIRDHTRVFMAFVRLLKSMFPALVASSLAAPDAQAAEFRLSVTHLPSGILVEKNGCRFRYTQAWERQYEDGWRAEDEVWKLLLDV